MPYIKIENRGPYNLLIKEVLQTITGGPETQFTQGEYFAFFLSRVCRKYLNTADLNNPSFNSALFSEPKRKALISTADKVVVHLSGHDPISTSGNLNYVISAVLWGAIGDAPNVAKAGYGFRCYMKGMVEQVRDALKDAAFVNSEQKERIINLRKYTIVCSVLNDVVAEFQRRKNSPYEDGKILENGDVWVDGTLLE